MTATTLNAHMKDGSGKHAADRGDLVQTIIIVAGFAVAAIVAIGGISSVLMAKSEGLAECVSGSTNFTAAGSAKADCATAESDAKTASDAGIAANFN